MQPTDRKLKELKIILDEAESKIAAAKRILFEQVYQEQALSTNTNIVETDKIVMGIFDGEKMIDSVGKKYPVPANYASKSKLVSGDGLKLTVATDGTFIFKQISPVERKRIVGTLSRSGDGWVVMGGSKKFKVLPASVTYFKANPNDEVTIIVPKVGESEWAAIENCLSRKSIKT